MHNKIKLPSAWARVSGTLGLTYGYDTPTLQLLASFYHLPSQYIELMCNPRWYCDILSLCMPTVVFPASLPTWFCQCYVNLKRAYISPVTLKLWGEQEKRQVKRFIIPMGKQSQQLNYLKCLSSVHDSQTSFNQSSGIKSKRANRCPNPMIIRC